MKKLDSLTRIISDSMTEMTKGAVEITETIIEANDITQQNKTSIDSLVSVMNKFTLVVMQKLLTVCIFESVNIEVASATAL